jgi:hypothetical protein
MQNLNNLPLSSKLLICNQTLNLEFNKPNPNKQQHRGKNDMETNLVFDRDAERAREGDVGVALPMRAARGTHQGCS